MELQIWSFLGINSIKIHCTNILHLWGGSHVTVIMMASSRVKNQADKLLDRLLWMGGQWRGCTVSDKIEISLAHMSALIGGYICQKRYGLLAFIVIPFGSNLGCLLTAQNCHMFTMPIGRFDDCSCISQVWLRRCKSLSSSLQSTVGLELVFQILW